MFKSIEHLSDKYQYPITMTYVNHTHTHPHTKTHNLQHQYIYITFKTQINSYLKSPKNNVATALPFNNNSNNTKIHAFIYVFIDTHTSCRYITQSLRGTVGCAKWQVQFTSATGTWCKNTYGCAIALRIVQYFENGQAHCFVFLLLSSIFRTKPKNRFSLPIGFRG
jgi:hypothetical protein